MSLRWLSDLGVAALDLVIALFFACVGACAIAIRAFDRWFDRQANRNRLFRRVLLVWAAGVITWVIWIVFTQKPVLAGNTVAAMSAVIGLLTVVIGFYQWSRAREDARANSEKEPPP